MAKRKITKASKRRLSIFGSLCVFAIFYSVFSLIYNIYTIYDLSMTKQKLEEDYINLQIESDNLKKDIEKLNDEKYLADYIREHYSYSHNDEYILKIDDDYLNITEEFEDEINNKYLIMAISCFILIIIMYVLFKGKKK